MDTKTVETCQLCKLKLVLPSIDTVPPHIVWICDRCAVRGDSREIQRLFGGKR